MAKKFSVNAKSKGVIRAGTSIDGLGKWKTSQDPRLDKSRNNIDKISVERVRDETVTKRGVKKLTNKRNVSMKDFGFGWKSNKG